MNNLVESLDVLKDISLLAKYRSICEENLPEMEQEKELLLYLEKYRLTYNVFPDSLSLKSKYPILKDGGVALPDPDKYILRKIAELRDKSIRRDLIKMSTQVNISPVDLDKMKLKFPSTSNITPLDHKKIDGAAIYKEISERPSGMKLFVDVVDDEIGGVGYGNIITLFGFVGSMKTTLALSAAYRNAVDLGYNSAYVTLEVPKDELYFNLLSRHAMEMQSDTKVTAKSLKKGLLTDEERRFIFEEVEPSFKEIKGTIYLLDVGDIAEQNSSLVTPASFQSALSSCNKDCGNDLDAFFIDYVNNMKFFKASSSEYGIDAFVAFLNDLVINFEGKKLIGWILTQANREGWKKAVRRGGKYAIDALAEFNQVERSSYYIVSLFHDDLLRASGELKLQLLKNRSGGVIEEPLTTLAVPENFFVGDSAAYKQSYTEEALEGLLE